MRLHFLSALFLLPAIFCSAQVKIIGHRGYSWLAPENTVASAKLAWENNADGVETDIFLTSDKKIICSHDASTKRTSGMDLKISETDSRVLRKLDVGILKSPEYRGERMPFLDELIKTVPAGKELVVEIKCGPEVLPYLEKVVSKYESKTEIDFICFDFQTIVQARKVFPKNDCYWLCSKKELLDKYLSAAHDSGLNGISLSSDIIDEDVFKRANDLGLDVYSWTIDKPEEAQRLIGLGVKGITTNRPGWLREQLGFKK